MNNTEQSAEMTKWFEYDIDKKSLQFALKKQKILIHGKWVESKSGETLNVVDPGTGQYITSIQNGNHVDVDDAVQSAHKALTTGEWPQLTPKDRELLLLKLADLVEINTWELAFLETLDSGKLLSESFEDIQSVPTLLRYMAGFCTKIEGITQPVSIPGKPFCYTTQEPIGVVAAIIPWNYPFSMAAWKIAPALATGCTIVLKPSELTSLTALRFGELLIEACYPPGVVNIVTGDGESVGKPLVNHPYINKVTFTGSTKVGKEIGKVAIQDVKRITLELGGKSPMIVFPDACLTDIVAKLASAIFVNQGQICTAGSRCYIHKSIYPEILNQLINYVKNMRVGHGLAPSSQMAAVISETHKTNILNHIKKALDEGANRHQGDVPNGLKGYFVPPTILTNVHGNMSCMKEEIFGPVLCIDTFENEHDVIKLANDTHYGLSASIWTQNISTSMRVIPQLKAGVIWVNNHNTYDPAIPFGGMKQSGIGRELGSQHLNAYLETKSVYIYY